MEQTGARPRHPAIALSAIPQPGSQECGLFFFSSANPDNFTIWRRNESQDATTVILKEDQIFLE
jgi:hypothetical protein